MPETHLDVEYLEFTPSDRSMVVVERAFPSLIHAVVDLEGDLDEERLRRAWQLMPVRHPILCCTAAWRGFSRTWIAGSSAPLAFLSEEERGGGPDGPGHVESRLLGERLDVAEGPLARLAALRRGELTRLLLTVHHGAMDARAVVMVVDDLRQAYLALARNRGYRPAPDLRPRTTTALLRRSAASPTLAREAFLRAQIEDRRRVTSTHLPPMPAARAREVDGPLSYVRYLFERELMEALTPLRRSRGWTVNDVFLGLLAWSWGEVLGRSEAGRSASGWTIPTDLRPRLGEAGGAGVLSGLEFVALEGVDRLDLAETIDVAAEVMAGYKARYPGLGSHVQLAWLQSIAPGPLFNAILSAGHAWRVKVKRYDRTFSNVGVLPEGLADWGEARARGAWVLAPVGTPPNTIVTASTFRGDLTLTYGFREPWLSPAQVAATGRTLRRGLESLLRGSGAG